MKKLILATLFLFLATLVFADTHTMDVGATREDEASVTIGDGSQWGRVPMDFYYKNSLYQCLYYQAELGFTAREITALKLYSDFESFYLNGATKIWLGTTHLSDLSGGYISADQLTLVYADSLQLPGGGQNHIHIDLQTPYLYLDGNLVMMVQRPMDSVYHFNSNGFRCQTGDSHRARNVYSNSIVYNPYNPPNGEPTGLYPRLTIYYNSNALQNDLGCTHLVGNTTPTVGMPATYTVNIQNGGINPQSNYQIKLMQEGGGELAALDGPPIQSMQMLPVNINWTPSQAGPISVYAKVVLAGDQFEHNNHSHPLDIIVQPEEIQVTTIGVGDQATRHPIQFSNLKSLYQCLYMQNELGFASGTITAVKLYNNFESDIQGSPIRIWLGSTNLSDLSGGYIPASQLSMVFDGNVDFPCWQNEILIPLTTPFMYTSGNLVMMVQRPMDGTFHTTYDVFKCQHGSPYRGRYVFSNREHFDPMNPPEGTPTAHYPKISLYRSSEPIINDLGCYGITGNTTPSIGDTSIYKVYIQNNGQNIQARYRILLMQEGGGNLATIVGPPIQPMQMLPVNISWIPTQEGAMSIYAKILYRDDEIEQNNTTAQLNITVQPEGTQMITFGEGNENDRIPIDISHKTSLSQTLWHEDELNLPGGTITSLQLYNHFSIGPLNSNAKIWLGSTELEDLRAGFIPAGELTLVFDGVILLPIGENEILIPLSTPYEITSGNLVMMIQRPWFSLILGSANYFKTQATAPRRTRIFYSNDSPIDPYNPPVAWDSWATDRTPQTTFFVAPLQMGSIMGVVANAINQPLEDAYISLNEGEYTVYTNSYGIYSLDAPVGIYSVTASAPGYITQTIENVEIDPNQTTHLHFVMVSETDIDDNEIPVIVTTLHPNYPNPFNPETTISYSIKDAGAVRLDIYNIKGQLVTTLVNEDKPSGHYKAVWNGRDASGGACSSGIYFYHLQAPGYRKVNKMLLSK
ncbi:MAG: carboxypeptidase regulatory-like domain-containing protein [Candidatus Cloacimonetes bacterium]|nr:carboxypeptidase regulatory-like domain-containing protein [Candidatus Cloacimonadota bacterium]